MAINYETIKAQINVITECFSNENHKSIIIDFSTFNDSAELDHFKPYLYGRLIGEENSFYEQNKERLEDFTNFEQQLLEMFYNDLAIKEFSSAMILSRTQIERPQILNSSQRLLEYLQNNQSTIKRACVSTEANPKILANELKAFGVGNRPAITLVSIKYEFDIDDLKEEELTKLSKEVRGVQLSNLAPIVDIKFKTSNFPNLFYNAKLAFSKINLAFIENDVESEYLIFCTNIIDLAIQFYGEGEINGEYANKQFGQQLAYFVVKTLFGSLPPSIGAIFFSFHREFRQSKKVFHTLNNLKNFSEYISWPFGVILNARIFDEVVKSYTIVQRQQSATITINQILKVVKDSISGIYKDEAESEVLKPIEIGSKSNASQQ